VVSILFIVVVAIHHLLPPGSFDSTLSILLLLPLLFFLFSTTACQYPMYQHFYSPLDHYSIFPFIFQRQEPTISNRSFKIIDATLFKRISFFSSFPRRGYYSSNIFSQLKPCLRRLDHQQKLHKKPKTVFSSLLCFLVHFIVDGLLVLFTPVGEVYRSPDGAFSFLYISTFSRLFCGLTKISEREIPMLRSFFSSFSLDALIATVKS